MERSTSCNLHKWITILRGLGLSQQILDSAIADARGYVIEFLQLIDDKLLQRNFNAGDITIPNVNLEDLFHEYVPNLPSEIITNAMDSFTDDRYKIWRHLVLCVLKDSIQNLKAGDDYSLEISAFETVSQKGVTESKSVLMEDNNEIIDNLNDLPERFTETENILELARLEFPVLQLYGERLCGKTFVVNGLLHRFKTLYNNRNLSAVIWTFSSRDNITEVLKELAKELLDKQIVSTHDFDSIFKEKNKLFANFLQLLKEKQIKLVFAIENVDESSKSVIREIMDSVSRLEQGSEITVQVIFTTRSRDVVYNPEEAANQTDLCQKKVKGYTTAESLKYLLSDNPPDSIYFSYHANDGQQRQKLFTEDGAKKVAEIFCNNPGALRLAKTYCLTRRLTFEQYAESWKHVQSRDYILEVEMEIANHESEETADAFRTLYGLRPGNYTGDDAKQKLEKIFEVLKFLHHDGIPILYVGKVCEQLRLNRKELSTDVNHELNKNESSDAAYRLKEEYSLENKSVVNYPNGVLSIPKHVFDSKQKSRPDDNCLQLALQVMATMLSKDNTKRKADMRLKQLQPHFQALAQHAAKYFRNNFNASDKQQESFLVAMLLCLLFERLGQAAVQGRMHTERSVALKTLMQAAEIIWEVACVYKTRKFTTLMCLLKKPPSPDDALQYSEEMYPSKQATKIVDVCIEAGRKIDGSCLEEYLRSSFAFVQQNVDDFVVNAMATLNISRDDAKQKLKEIQNLVEKKAPCEAHHMKLLRDTSNLLSVKQLQVSFFSERLSSIFHTYGRQVLYLQSDMTEHEQKRCEYYTKLAHQIALKTRQKTGVGLLNEYITYANAMIPRLLQNRQGETNEERIKRLRESCQKSQEIVNVDTKFYENGCFRLVSGTDYTNLNGIKYSVKGYTKLMKTCTPADLPDNAWNDCERMLELAKKNASLDMAPHCIIQGAKFLAATGRFDKAFEAFADGFSLKNIDDEPSGVVHLRDWRPNSFAWAVNNLCMALDAYSRSEERSEERVKERTMRAVYYCREVVALGGVNQQWKDVAESWLERFN